MSAMPIVISRTNLLSTEHPGYEGLLTDPDTLVSCRSRHFLDKAFSSGVGSGRDLPLSRYVSALSRAGVTGMQSNTAIKRARRDRRWSRRCWRWFGTDRRSLLSFWRAGRRFMIAAAASRGNHIAAMSFMLPARSRGALLFTLQHHHFLSMRSASFCSGRQSFQATVSVVTTARVIPPSGGINRIVTR